MVFRKIDRSNYWECMELTVDDSQKDFVADNKQSLVEAAYEENLYTLGIYCQDTMVGFILYDYDDQIPGWSMSRFMIGKQYQGKGYGKRLMEYARDKKHMDKVDVNEQNEKALQFYLHLGFQVIGRDETDSMGKPFPILHLQLPEADSTNRD